MKTLDYIAGGPDTVGWKVRHRWAVSQALAGADILSHVGRKAKPKAAYALVRAICSWITYAEAHQARYESNIGDDGFLGPAWEAWGRALRTMLNGETGDLDCGTLDSIILDNLIEQGFTEE